MSDRENKPEKLRERSAGELETELGNAREELMNLRFQQVTGQLSDSSRLRILRRKIARIETILYEQKSAEVVKGEA